MKRLLALAGLFFLTGCNPLFAQPGPSSLPGCVYNATPPTLADKQQTTWQCDVNGNLKLSAVGVGDVVGPAVATDGAAALFDGTTGKLLADSKVILTVPASAATLTLGSGKTVTISNTLTFTGTDASSVAFGAGGTVLYTGSTIPLTVGTTTIASGTTTRILYDNAGVLGEYTLQGTGTAVVMATAPTITAPLTLTGVVGSSALTINGATQTASFPALNATQTWNNAGVTFTGLKLNVTSTASAAASLLLDLQVGAASKFTVRKDGYGVLAVGLDMGANGFGLYTTPATLTGLIGFMNSTAVGLNSAMVVKWSDGPTSVIYDTFLLRDAANTLAQRNGTTAQAQRWYNSYTNASNGEWFAIDWISNVNVLTLSTSYNGTGTGRPIVVGVGGTYIKFYTGATANQGWQINNGHLLASTDNTYDIGASGATRPRTGYFGTSVLAPSFSGDNATMTGNFIITGVGGISTGGADGVLKLRDAANTSFSRLVFGGTTSSFPALKRSTTNLEVKLADDSTYSSIAARSVIAAGAVPTLTLNGGTCAGTVIAGGSAAGTVTLTGVCAATNTMALTVMPTAPTGYICDAVDRTLGTVVLGQTGTTTTSATFTFLATTGATDVIAYKCIAY